ncbi:GAF domain-containing protein [Plasticicumulans lactativorans]|uniref:GAF domain-containing protein n=1 Tax=Plasticicumulans lactativorans TaxID=1133106 RepID=A0A4R2L026_9GAMM|nr:GAF domain-containing protein [Plasticicumulans lactativorans]TCO78852.1 GAF domain-containing protein [Plasticicumulans lactativorans]
MSAIEPPPAPAAPPADDLPGRLQRLVAYVSAKERVDDDLAELARLTAGLLGAEACSIMLFKEDAEGHPALRVSAHWGDLPPGAYAASVAPGEGIAGRVAAEGRPILADDVAHSPYAALGRQGGGGFICAPIAIAGRVAGVLNLSTRSATGRFGAEGLALAGLLGVLLGVALQTQRLQAVLRSRFAQRALAAELRDDPGMDAVRLGADAERMARVLGRSFFRELQGAGFGRDHILSAATELIGALNRSYGSPPGVEGR